MVKRDEIVHRSTAETELRICRSFEEFDATLGRMGIVTDLDKIAYLKKTFDIDIVHATDDDKHTDYVAMASTIMNM